MLGQLSQKRSATGTRWLVWSGTIAIVSLVGTAAYAFLLNRPTDPIPVSLVTPQRGNVERSINESGSVELRGQVTIKSPIEGAVDQVLVQPGQRVKAGQLLVTLRYPERQTALASQQLQIQQQELLRQRQEFTRQQQELLRQQREITLERNRQRVQESKERLAIEEQELQKLQALVAEGAIEQQRVQDREDRVRTARIAVREAQAAQQESQLTKFNARIAEQDAQLATNAAKIELQRSQLERQRIVQQLQNSEIRAPIDGVVLDVKVIDGDGVQHRTELLTLGDPSQEFIQLRLSTLDATRVRINQLARVSVIGPDATVHTGRVLSLHPQAVLPEQNKQNGRTSSQATVPAIVKLTKPTGTLIPGAQVNVEIVLEQQKDVLTLSTEAIQRSEKTPFVWIKDSEGNTQKRPITIGLEGLVSVQVKQGLNPGDRVILPPAEPPLKPGMPVTEKRST